MIDRNVFELKILLLEERFGFKISDLVRDEYFDILVSDYKMTQADFLSAVRRIFREYDRFPSPKAIYEAVNLSGESLALLEWQAIQEYWKTPPDKRQKLCIGEVGMQSYRAIGGTAAMRQANNETIAYLKRDFLKYHTAYRQAADLSEQEKLLLPKVEIKALPQSN